MAARASHLRNWCDAYAFVYDRHAEFASNVVAGFYQIASVAGNLVKNFFAASVDVAVGAVEQADAHSDGADIEIFLLNHFVGFVNFKKINHDRGVGGK